MKSSQIPFFGGATGASEAPAEGVANRRSGKSQGSEFARFLSQSRDGKGAGKPVAGHDPVVTPLARRQDDGAAEAALSAEEHQLSEMLGAAQGQIGDALSSETAGKGDAAGERSGKKAAAADRGGKPALVAAPPETRQEQQENVQASFQSPAKAKAAPEGLSAEVSAQARPARRARPSHESEQQPVVESAVAESSEIPEGASSETEAVVSEDHVAPRTETRLPLESARMPGKAPALESEPPRGFQSEAPMAPGARRASDPGRAAARGLRAEEQERAGAEILVGQTMLAGNGAERIAPVERKPADGGNQKPSGETGEARPQWSRQPVARRSDDQARELVQKDGGSSKEGQTEEGPRFAKASRQETVAVTAVAPEIQVVPPPATAPVPSGQGGEGVDRPRGRSGERPIGGRQGDELPGTAGHKHDLLSFFQLPAQGAQPVGFVAPGTEIAGKGVKLEMAGIAGQRPGRLVEAAFAAAVTGNGEGNGSEPRRVSQRELELAALAPAPAPSLPVELLLNGTPPTASPEMTAPPVLPPAAAPIIEHALQDPGLAVTVLPQTAHVHIAGDDGRALELHLRMLPEGGADIRAAGTLAPMVQARVAELGMALAAQGLSLGSFEMNRGDSHESSYRESGEESGEGGSDRTISTSRKQSDGGPTATRGGGRIHVKA